MTGTGAWRVRAVTLTPPTSQRAPNLTAAERRLYEALYAADGAVVPHAALLVILFGEQPEYDRIQRETAKTYIWRLRRKGVEITTVKGVGYALGSKRCPTCGQMLPEKR